MSDDYKRRIEAISARKSEINADLRANDLARKEIAAREEEKRQWVRDNWRGFIFECEKAAKSVNKDLFDSGYIFSVAPRKENLDDGPVIGFVDCHLQDDVTKKEKTLAFRVFDQGRVQAFGIGHHFEKGGLDIGSSREAEISIVMLDFIESFQKTLKV